MLFYPLAEANGNEIKIHCRPIYGTDEYNKERGALAKQNEVIAV
jgi:hypothetical protein